MIRHYRLKEIVFHQESVEKYHQSVTQLPPMSEIMEEEEEGRRCKCCPTSITSILSRMFDFTLLTSPTFIVLGLAGFMSLMALFIPFMFLPGKTIISVVIFFNDQGF